MCWVTLCATVDVQTERHSALAMSRSRLLKEAYHGPCHGAPFCEHCSLKGEPPKYNVPHVYHVPSKSLAHALTQSPVNPRILPEADVDLVVPTAQRAVRVGVR